MAIFYLGDYGVSVEEINGFFEFLLLSRLVSQLQCDIGKLLNIMMLDDILIRITFTNPMLIACKVKISPCSESTQESNTECAIMKFTNSKYSLNIDLLRELSSFHYKTFVNSPTWWNGVYKNKNPQNLYECLVIHTELINSVLMQSRRGENSMKLWLKSTCRSNSNVSVRNAMQWISTMEKSTTRYSCNRIHQNIKIPSANTSSAYRNRLCSQTNNAPKLPNRKVIPKKKTKYYFVQSMKSRVLQKKLCYETKTRKC